MSQTVGTVEINAIIAAEIKADPGLFKGVKDRLRRAGPADLQTAEQPFNTRNPCGRLVDNLLNFFVLAAKTDLASEWAQALSQGRAASLKSGSGFDEASTMLKMSTRLAFLFELLKHLAIAGRNHRGVTQCRRGQAPRLRYSRDRIAVPLHYPDSGSIFLICIIALAADGAGYVPTAGIGA